VKLPLDRTHDRLPHAPPSFRGVCGRVGRRPSGGARQQAPRGPAGERQVWRPFSASSPEAVHLLVAFVLEAEEARDARRAWLGPDAAAPPGGGEMPPDGLPLASACALDGLLAGLLGPHARAFEGRSVAALAELWWREKHLLRGAALAALLWRLARDDRAAVRPLERQVARGMDSRRLLHPHEPGDL